MRGTPPTGVASARLAGPPGQLGAINVADDPSVDLDQGYVGIQNHGGDDVSFRYIRTRELQ
ncbi:MAG TPA: hypothetical protein VEX15_07705 [Nocardioidaceae bacterium]|nr:hypothetical protein [Nocardioidaceae bacterium]